MNKKNQIYYNYLVNTEEIILTLEDNSLDEVEKEELMNIIDQTLHQQTLEVILDHLPKEFHQVKEVISHRLPVLEHILV